MTQVKIDMSGFKTIKKALSDKFKTRVGILGGKASESHKGTELTNADLGAIHEFGSLSNNIPPRSFLRLPLEAKLGEWINKNRSRYMELMEQGNVRKFYVGMGLAAEGIIDEAFVTSGFGSWPPDKPETVKRKGSSMPLLDTGQLRASITSKVMSDDK